MAEFRINKGDELVIGLKKGTHAEVGGRRRSSVRHRGRDESYPARRLAGLINFYDLGQKKNGSGLFEDLSFLVSPTITPDYSAPPPIGPADVAALYDQIFSVPFGQWSQKFKRFSGADAKLYKQVVSGESFGLDFSDGEAEWTGQGLKLSSAQLSDPMFRIDHFLGISWSPFFGVTLKSSDPSNRNHITETLDPDAPESSSFAVGGKMDIYLMPRILFSGGEGSFEVTPGVTLPLTLYLLNQNYVIFPRAVLLDAGNPYHSLVDFWAFSGDFLNDFPTDTPSYEQAIAAANFHKSLVGARALTRNTGGGSWASVSAGSYPTPEMVPPPGAYGNPPHFSAFFAAATYSEPALIAVVIKGSSKYYVWSSSAA